MAERPRRDHAIVQIDLSLEPFSRRCVLVLAFLLDAAIGQNHVRALAELQQQRLELFVIQFVQGRVDMTLGFWLPAPAVRTAWSQAAR